MLREELFQQQRITGARVVYNDVLALEIRDGIDVPRHHQGQFWCLRLAHEDEQIGTKLNAPYDVIDLLEADVEAAAFELLNLEYRRAGDGEIHFHAGVPPKTQ